MALLNNHVDTQIGPASMFFIFSKEDSEDKDLEAEFEKALLPLEEVLQSGGPYMMGNDFTLADVHFLPFYLRLRVTLKHFKGYDLTRNKKFPELEQWFLLCSEKESVKAAAKSPEEIIEVYEMLMKSNSAWTRKN